MGCSPSKSNHLVRVQHTLKKGCALLPGSLESNTGLQLGEAERRGCSKQKETLGKDEGAGRGEGGAHDKRSAVQLPQKPTPVLKRCSLSEMTLQGPVPGKLTTQEIKLNTTSWEEATEQNIMEEKSGKKGGRKASRTKGSRKDKVKRASGLNKKVDFPEPLVTAHQAAYAYLNPSINKYEVLLSLLDQAAQTQLFLQPMVAFMALRYEEVNCVLAQITNEGERLLQENGDHLAWPCPLKNVSSTRAEGKEALASVEPSPDLLQQLLQYTTQRMRVVSHSVGSVADSALEDAVHYFSSFSELLYEKLEAKRAAEARLAHVLSRIELATIHRPSPDDSTLFSEDSGIGADCWSLTGSERRRESWESAGNIRATHGRLSDYSDTPMKNKQNKQSRAKRKGKISLSVSSMDSNCTIKAEDQKDMESPFGSISLDDGEDEEEEKDLETGTVFSPTGLRRLPHRLPKKRIENSKNVEMTLKMKDSITGRLQFVPLQHPTMNIKQVVSSGTRRSQGTKEELHLQLKSAISAASSRGSLKKTLDSKSHHSHSVESHYSKVESPAFHVLEKVQKDGAGSENQSRGRSTRRGRAEKMSGSHSPTSDRQCSSLPRNFSSLSGQDKLRFRRHSSGEKEVGTDEEERKKIEKKAEPVKSTIPLMAEHPPPLNRGRCSVKKLIDTFSQGLEEKQNKGSSTIFGPLRVVQKCGVPIIPGLGNGEFALINSNTSCYVGLDSTHKTDSENFPPPPPEVLMDNSFQTSHEYQVSDGGDSISNKVRSPLLQKAKVSQRLRASMHSVVVLPSRGTVQPCPPNTAPVRPVHQDAALGPESGPKEVGKETSILYKQACKVIHLQDSTELSMGKPVTQLSISSLAGAGTGRKVSEGDLFETVPSSPGMCCHLPATPPISKARKLPSTPANLPSQHRRLPNPPAFKTQSTQSSSSSPPSSRKLPTPPVNHRSLPSPLQAHKTVGSQMIAPSPPLSRREATPNHTITSYPFRAPSPPASPRVQRKIQENSSDEVTSSSSSLQWVSSNAHSVFCPASASLFEAQPYSESCTPQAWGLAAGPVPPQLSGGSCLGRLPVAVPDPRPFIRRSQSDRRPSRTRSARIPTASIAQSCGSEPAISTKGLENAPSREEDPWGSQSDLSAAGRSASQPDLCVVGVALRLE